MKATMKNAKRSVNVRPTANDIAALEYICKVRNLDSSVESLRHAIRYKAMRLESHQTHPTSKPGPRDVIFYPGDFCLALIDQIQSRARLGSVAETARQCIRTCALAEGFPEPKGGW